MATLEQKRKTKEVLSALNINPNINLPYFLDCIAESNQKVKSLESQLQLIIFNQQQLDRKLDKIIRLINK